MLHGILKQNQVHGGVEFVIAVQHFCEYCPEHFPVLHGLVAWLHPIVGKMAINEGLLKQRVTVYTLPEDKEANTTCQQPHRFSRGYRDIGREEPASHAQVGEVLPSPRARTGGS